MVCPRVARHQAAALGTIRNMVGKKQGHAKAYEVGQFLSKTAPFLIIDSSPAARDKALSQLLTLSASVSYTDAVVMAVADEYATQKIFGFDEAFANCGYEHILRWSAAKAA